MSHPAEFAPLLRGSILVPSPTRLWVRLAMLAETRSKSPGYTTWDFSVFKNFRTTERTNLEFRAEFFNVLNHTNFLFANSGPQNGNNATILGTSQFGSLTAARTPRQIQFALKFSF